MYSTYDSGRIYSSWDSTDDSWNKSFISFQTHGDNTSSYTDDLVIKGGNVGIGTSDPKASLDVRNDFVILPRVWLERYIRTRALF